MSVEAMHGLASGQTRRGSFGRSALALSVLIGAVALLFLPYAMLHSGSTGPWGVAVAAAITLVSAWASEGLAFASRRSGGPLAGLLMGMITRMAPPMVVCIVLAAQGVDSRRHLPFICYLLVFYLATLALETWLAVQRVPHTTPDLNHGTR
jgi:hypothetical protein